MLLSSEDTLLTQEVMSLMQLVQDVNAMAEDLDRHTRFEIMLLSPEARGLETGRTEVTQILNNKNTHARTLYLYRRMALMVKRVYTIIPTS